MTLPLTRSLALWQRAQQVIPNGTQTLSKGPHQFVYGVSPIYLERGEGSHVWDVDGNEYVDYPMSLGPILLGHAYPATVAAIQRQLLKGITFTLMHPMEVELAELIQECVPYAEMIRFAKNGSDVTSAAIRLARAYTGREKVACCGYHGWQDWYAAATPRRRGVPQVLGELIHPFHYNHLTSLEQIFNDYRGEIAAVILEQGAEDPEDNFLHRVKTLAHANGALFIMDEVVTGFRYALGGVSELYGLTPDLACFGKALANGMPLSVLCGKREVMKHFEGEDGVFFSTTFGGEALSLAAAISTLQELQEKPVIPYLWKMGLYWRDNFNSMAQKLGVDAKVIGQGPRTSFVFVDPAMRALFLQETVKRGILFGGPVFMTYSHTLRDFDHTLGACEAALRIIQQAEEGNYARYLEGYIPQTIFREKVQR